MPASFLIREKEEEWVVGGSGEDLGGVGEGEKVIRIHCMKKTIFNNNKKKKK